LIYIQLDFVNILDILTTISNHINKQRKTSSKQSLTRKIHLLYSLSSDPTEILSYNHCIRLEFLSYEISPLDSSHYIEYIRKNRSDCNILDVSSKQLLTISVQYLRIEAELEEAEKYIVRL